MALLQYPPSSKASLERGDDGHARFHGCTTIRDFEILSKLGEGTFGEVYKAKAKKNSSVVALKKILMHNEKDGFPITALREVKLLKMLSHANILQLDEMAVERSRAEGRKKASMYMVTSYMEHDLSGLLENPDVQLTEPQIKCYLLQLLEGLRYLHDNRILHRDMKAANLLISNQGIQQIADFGLARPYEEAPPLPGGGGGDGHREYTVLVVTRWYRPPELLLKLSQYTTAIDMWGVGCVFGEMFKRKPILTGSSDLNQLQIIFDLVGSPTDDNMPGWSRLPGCDGVKEFAPRTGNLPQVFREQGSSAISLLSDLLRLDWRKRINAIDALKHPYFRTAPLPARPGELPRFEDSHELDRRKFRAQKQNPPPAPQGGQVGMGPEGQWAAGPGPRPGGREAMDPRQGRVGPGAYVNGTGNQNFGPRKGHESRIPDSHRQTSQEPPSHRPWARDDGLPPRPPPTTNQPWNNPPWEGGRNNNNDRRDRGPPPSRNDRAPGTGGPGGAGPKKDTYIPSYSNASERARPPPRDDGVRRDDRPTSRGRYDGPRDQDDRAYMRRRSRSPRDRSHDDRREYRR